MASLSGLPTPLRPWWKSASIYQIYPASFKDSNGDGIGDLPGIISKLDYLQGLGVDAIWISPFYETPNYDMGYDISDYTKPDPAYGKLEDVDALIKGAHDRGMKILFDLVINHTSHLHRWFKDAESSKDSPYRHYYIWRPPRYVDGKRLPPTNWKASFGGSVWEWSEKTQEYYLHCFTKEQPDLNWELEEVRDAVFKDSITFWLDRGVDGFRIDTIAMYSKGEYVDVPVVDPHSYVQPAYESMHFGPRLHEWLQEMHKKTFDKYDAVSIGEFGGDHDTPFMLKFVGEEQKKFNMAIRFDMVHLDHGPEFGLYPRKWTLPEFKTITARCQELADPVHRGWLCNYFENHDQARSVSRFADDSPEYRVQSAKMLALHIVTLSGTLLVYEGQEIGMINMPKDWPIEEYIDPASIMHWKDIQEAAKHRPETYNMEEAMRGMQLLARDHGRNPMQWSAEKQAGFTTADKAWMRVMDSYKDINVETEEADPSSVLHFWRKALKLRKDHLELFVFGHFELLEPDGTETLLYTKQSYDAAKPIILVALNFSKKEQSINIPASLGENPKLLVSTEGDDATASPSLKPWEGKVFIFE